VRIPKSDTVSEAAQKCAERKSYLYALQRLRRFRSYSFYLRSLDFENSKSTVDAVQEDALINGQANGYGLHDLSS
jgi:hypothetical protein